MDYCTDVAILASEALCVPLLGGAERTIVHGTASIRVRAVELRALRSSKGTSAWVVSTLGQLEIAGWADVSLLDGSGPDWVNPVPAQ
jgi:hypothetical protein